MAQIIFDLPDTLLNGIEQSLEEVANEARLFLAIGWYVYNGFSLGYCSHVAGMTEEEFIMALGEKKISIFRFDSVDELVEDLNNA